MAINSKDVKKAYEAKMAQPFNEEELTQLKEREDKIDSILKEKFNDGPVRIELAHFLFDPYSWERSKRNNMLRAELEKRYKEAGWTLKVELDDGLDGPNMSGPDYMILTPVVTRNKK
jgi:hypothetical protein